MKKLYSFVLMATMLLIGTNVWGQKSISMEYYDGPKAGQTETFSSLQAAIDAIAPGDSATITLNGPQELETTILIPHLKGTPTSDAGKIAKLERQHICINLNGFDIKTKSTVSAACFSLVKGVLRITGEGTVERVSGTAYADNWDRGAIIVAGTDGKRTGYTGDWSTARGVTGIVNEDRSKQEWSTLYIDKGVTVESSQAGTYGIGIQEVGDKFPHHADFKAAQLGYTCVYDVKKSEPAKQPMWNISHDLINKDHPEQGEKDAQSQWSCFGVKVIINGNVHGERRGINVLGSINQTPGVVEGHTSRYYNAYPYYEHNFPYVKIGKDAEVYCAPSGISDDGNGGIYLGGWAVIDIEGAVHGQTGIMVKAGDVLVQDGSVYSDSQTADNNGNYHGTVGGSGIFVTSSASYAGESSVTVAGDSYIAGKGGCAIIDVCATSTSEQTNTAVTHIDITGGTIVAGNLGAISLGTNTSNVTDITGGVVEGKVDIGDASDETQRFHTDVTNLLPNTTNYHTTEVTHEDGTKTVVVSKGGTLNTYATWSDIVTNEGGNYTGFENVVIGDGTNTITQTLDKLEINSGYKEPAPSTTVHNQTLTIKNHATLQVNQLTMNGFARITVEAGGKLIVKGEQGIVAPSVNNITLESSESAQAYFLFHPGVQSNRHPMATVKLTSKGYVKNGDYDQKVWQRFGVPAYTAKEEEGAVIRYSENPADNPVTYNYASWIEVYDYSIDNWKTMPDAEAFVPFQCYEASSIATQANHTIYTFKCPLMGNSDFTLPLNEYTEWNYYANSYMAPINIQAMLQSFVNDNANVDATVYVYRSSDNWWDDINLLSGYFSAQTTIDPMQAFIFKKRVVDGASSAVINYKNHIYNPDPNTTDVPAPAREHEVYGAAIIEITAADGAKDKLYLVESDKFSADFDNGYDAAKYLNNESFNLFAGEKMSKVATDNLEGTTISMTTKAQTSFTMTFSNVKSMEYAVRDNLTGTETAIVEGATYMFSTAANAKVEGRFEIVPVAKMPTAIENIEETAAVKGIYTITGQFVGNDYHNLPNGVYVVDGKKIVK